MNGAARRTAPLFVADAAGTPLTCDGVDRMFNALAFATLPAAVARRRSFHSCRVFAASCHKAHDESDDMTQALCCWRTAASLKIYARINPRDCAARVRRMLQTDVDSTISAHLLSICDSELHGNMGPVANALTSGTDVADTCGGCVFDDEDEPGDDEPERQAAQSRRRQLLTAAPLALLPLRHHFGIALKQSNPKPPGSKSHGRYEVYKVAATRAQFRALGGFVADYARDYRKGYVKLLSSREGHAPYRERAAVKLDLPSHKPSLKVQERQERVRVSCEFVPPSSSGDKLIRPSEEAGRQQTRSRVSAWWFCGRRH